MYSKYSRFNCISHIPPFVYGLLLRGAFVYLVASDNYMRRYRTIDQYSSSQTSINCQVWIKASPVSSIYEV